MIREEGLAETSSRVVLTASHEPESPFLDTFIPAEETIEERFESLALPTQYQLESPFLSVYELEIEEGFIDGETVDQLDFLAELYDEEFDEALFELMNEASDILDERFTREVEGLVSYEVLAERVLEEYFAPLTKEMEALLDRMVANLDGKDLNALTEAEFDALLDSNEPQQTGLAPTFEDFLKKWKKKAKKLAKKAAKLAQKYHPAAIALRKLKSLAKPLLLKALQVAINKLPASLQPMVTTLAKRFLKTSEVGQDLEERDEPAAETVGWIQHEFDVTLTQLLFATEEVEQEVVISEFVSETASSAAGFSVNLDQARAGFMDQITQLEEGEDPTPLIENYVTAILTALKFGIKIIGRKRVVNFLAKLITKMIQRFVGKKNAPMLSRAIVEAGLKYMGLELNDQEEANVAGAALAATVEETVYRVSALPDYILDDEALLESYVMEAFEVAVASNFPPAMVKPELHEATDGKATWVMLPVQGRKYYKKYTEVFEVSITPQTAQAIQTFGGLRLVDFLRDQLTLTGNNNIKAYVHLYEAVPGTWLSRISKHEKNVPGLGSATKAAWSQLHPLTQKSAGLLLQQPGLGRNVSDKFLSNRNNIAVGQRFYYLQIPGNRPQLVKSTANHSLALKRIGEVNLALNFIRNHIQVLLFFSETQAQEIATKLREKASVGAVMKLVRAAYESTLNTIRSGRIRSHVKIVHESVPPEESFSPLTNRAIRWLGLKAIGKLVDKLLEWLGNSLANYFQKHAQDFIRSTENSADGVTLIVTFINPPGFSTLSKIFKGQFIKLTGNWFPDGLPETKIRIIPGFSNE